MCFCPGLHSRLGLSAWEFFTPIVVTHVSIRTSDTSSKLLNSPSPPLSPRFDDHADHGARLGAYGAPHWGRVRPEAGLGPGADGRNDHLDGAHTVRDPPIVPFGHTEQKILTDI